jgi:putative acetyltransferase
MNRLPIRPGLMEKILGMPRERLAEADKFICGLSPYEHGLWPNDYGLIAEVEGAMVGRPGLHLWPSSPKRYTAWLGSNVQATHQRKGLGKSLMSAILDISQLAHAEVGRTQLFFTDNESAIDLYQKRGFVVEGRKKYSAVLSGVPINEYLRARYGA